MSTTDRAAVGYEPRFDIDCEIGHQGELVVLSTVEALKTGRAEVKTDVRCLQTGNLYIEYRCRRRDGWHDSGIADTETDVWAFVIGDLVLVVPTATLVEIAREAWRNPANRREETNGSHPTQGVVIAVNVLVDEMRRRGRDA